MTDAVLSTEGTNQVPPFYTLPGGQVGVITPPPAVPPNAPSVNNQNTQSLLVLASTGAFKLSTALNTGGSAGPATALAGMANCGISGQNVP